MVDTNSRQIDVFRRPSPGGYARHTTHRLGQSVRPEAFDDVMVAVADVVG